MADNETNGRFSRPEGLLLFLTALGVRALGLIGRAGDPADRATEWVATAGEGLPIPSQAEASDAVVTLLAGATRLLPSPSDAELRVRELFGDPDPALIVTRVALVILGALAVPLVALAGARLAGRMGGLLAGGLLALSPFAIECSVTIGPATFLLLGASGVLAALTASTLARRDQALLGESLGVALAAGGGGGLGLLIGAPFARTAGPGARGIAVAALTGAVALVIVAPGVLFGFPRVPGSPAGEIVRSPLLAGVVMTVLAAGPVVFVLAIVGKLDLLRRSDRAAFAVLPVTAGAFLVPILWHGASPELLAGSIPGLILLATVAILASPGAPLRRAAGLIALMVSLIGAAMFLIGGMVRSPAATAAEWIQRNVEQADVVMLETGGPRLPTLNGAAELEEHMKAGAIAPERLASYPARGKLFQTVPLPADGAREREAALFYDPNLAQFFHWIVLADLAPPARDEAAELTLVRRVFHDYFPEDWEVAGRFEQGLSRHPGVTVLRQREDFNTLDRQKLGPLAGVLDGDELAEVRDGSGRFHEWVVDAGVAFRRVNELTAAQRFLDLAVKRDSTDIDTRYQRALVLLQREKTDGAKRDLLRVLSDESFHGGAHYNLGTILELEEDFEGAMTEFAAGIIYLENPVPAHTRLGALMVRLGMEQEAREQLEEVRRLDPGGEGEQILEALLGSP